jgi:NmrA-like family
MSNAANAALAEPWKDLWNGDLSVTEKIIAEDFVAHAAPLTGTETDQIRGRQALNGWVSGIHAVLADLAFVIEVGPITDEEHMVVRWKARRTYRGGFPGASPEAADRGRLPAGVEVTVGDFDDPASLAAALRGAGRAYLVTPSSQRAEAQQRRFADLAVQAGVGHLVALSQLGADEHSPVRFLRYHAAVEHHIRDLGTGYTFLRPNLFFQGLLAFARTIAADGRFYAPIGAATVSAVDVRDIAAVAAAALTETGHDGATYTLTGPRPSPTRTSPRR